MVQVEGSSMGLLAGDRVTLHDLLYGLLLASGNDAANVIATVIGGSADGFAKLMNERAKRMGLIDTHFVTPSGLDDEEHYTTAYELALIAKEAMQNEEFKKAVSSKSAVLNYGNPPYRRRLTNHNKLLNYDNSFIGVKTGFTKKSGRCLVSARKRDGKYVICVTLCAPNDWNDHKILSEYGLNELKQITFKPQKETEEIEVIGASEKLKVNLGSFFVNTTSDDNIEFKVNLPKFLYAPIKKGEVIGSIECTQNGKVCLDKKITANEDVRADKNIKSNKSKFLKFARMIISEI
jgi:D-alanyl-D-alanine carboxypeptidase/D-alanyl-D-alanine carboxypeptidase (penicillin-binding protein 5/6)